MLPRALEWAGRRVWFRRIPRKDETPVQIRSRPPKSNLTLFRFYFGPPCRHSFPGALAELFRCKFGGTRRATFFATFAAKCHRSGIFSFVWHATIIRERSRKVKRFFVK